jgi:hypothetical protein
MQQHTARIVGAPLLIALATIALVGWLGIACGSPQPVASGAPGAVTQGAVTPVPTRDWRTFPTTFDGFPVLWLGQAYDADGDGVAETPLHYSDYWDYPAVYVDGRLSQPEHQAFALAYGLCTPSEGSEQCTAPISLSISPPDDMPLSDAVKSGQTVEIRGAEFTVFGDGQLYLRTPEYAIIISAGGLEWAIGVANQLVGANPKGAHITRQTDFYGNPLTGPRPTRTPSPVPTPRPYVTAPAPLCTVTINPGEFTPGPVRGCAPNASPTVVATAGATAPAPPPTAGAQTSVATAEAP